jgi:uncharacterized protein YdhG (YjbR/CyaY superfamily)
MPAVTKKDVKSEVEGYFDSLPLERRQALQTLRAMIKRIWPGIIEDMALGIPTYHMNREPFCAIANQKGYMALYIMPYDMLAFFKNDLKALDHGRSCIRFRHAEPRIMDLFDQVLKYAGSRHTESLYYGELPKVQFNGRQHRKP